MTCCHQGHPLIPEPAVFVHGRLVIGCLDKNYRLAGLERALTTMQFYKTRRVTSSPYDSNTAIISCSTNSISGLRTTNGKIHGQQFI